MTPRRARPSAALTRKPKGIMLSLCVAMKRLRVGVIYGGRSGEHEVSLASAAAVFKHLDPQRYEPIAIRIEKDGRWTLPPRPPSVVSAADVIHSKIAERPDSAPEAHVIAHPGGDTLLK